MSNMFQDLQDAVIEQLRADDDVIGPVAVQILTENVSDINAEIQRLLDSSGLVITVLTPRIARGDTDEISTDILLYIDENVGVNQSPAGTRRTALDLVASVIACLDDWAPLEGRWGAMRWTSALMTDVDPVVSWEVTFTTACQFGTIPSGV